ncbi:MAG: hypothetical protein QW597_02900 [Thermoplasmataceae archaeon]
MPDPDSELSDPDHIRALIRDIYLAKSRQEKEEKLADTITYLKGFDNDPGKFKGLDLNHEISKLITSVKKISHSRIKPLLTELLIFFPDNLDIKHFYSVIIYKKEQPDEFVEYVYSDSDFCGDEDTESRFMESYDNISDPAKAAIFFSMCGKYDQKMFSRYFQESLDDDTSATIIKNFQKSEKYGDLSRFLEVVTEKEHSIAYDTELINSYQKAGELGKMSKAISKLNYDEIGDVDSFMILIKKSIASENYPLASEIARHALSEYPEDHQLLSALGDSLYLSKNYDAARETFTGIHNLFKDDYDAVRKLISISEETRDFKDMIEWIDILCSELVCSKDEVLKKIRAEIELSMFDDALRDINEQNSPVKDLDFCRLLFDLDIKLGKVTDSLNMAEEILKLSPGDEPATTYILDDLFKKSNYEGFLDRISRIENENTRSMYESKVVAALLYLGNFEEAVKKITVNPSVIQSEYLIDAIYSVVDKDEEILEIQHAVLLTGVKSPYIEMVLDNVRGKKVIVRDSLPEIVTDSSPVSVVSIVTFDNVHDTPEVIPDALRKLISKPKYKNIQIIIDTISEINSSRVSKDIMIFQQERFPAITALIRKGYLDKAREQLNSLVDKRDKDPFYDYVEALLLFKEGDITQSEKSIARAISMLSNVDFFNLEISINLLKNREKAALNDIDTILAIGCGDFIDFSELYAYVGRTGSFEFRNRLLEALSDVRIENPWFYRLLRDREIAASNFVPAEKYSRNIISGEDVKDEDIKAHVHILENLELGDTVIEFLLEQEERGGSIFIENMIGDWYFEKGDFNDALAFYTKAISRGAKPESISNYIETLIETKNFDEARKLIGANSPSGMDQLKLYYKAGEIQKIIDLLKNIRVETREDEERISYISRVLWINREVRDILIGIYEQEGFLFLGHIISDRLMDSNEYERAIDVMRNIRKNYPEDVGNLLKLSGAYEKIGKYREAVEVLQHAIKIAVETENKAKIVDSLLRIYYGQRMYIEIRKFYESNRDMIDSTNIHFIVRSYLELGDYDSAESLVGKYHGSIVSNETFQEFTEEIGKARELRDIMNYADRLLRLEYKAGKKFSIEDAVSRAAIPLEKVEDVFLFLTGDQGYTDMNDEKYEMLSRDIIQRVCKKTKVSNIGDLNISVIYNNMDRRDVTIAKNIYAYIKRETSRVRKPRIEDQDLQKLLRIALKQDTGPEPYRVACRLNIGVSEAMEVISLMSYVSSVNTGGRAGSV